MNVDDSHSLSLLFFVHFNHKHFLKDKVRGAFDPPNHYKRNYVHTHTHTQLTHTHTFIQVIMQFLTKLYRMTNNPDHHNCIEWSDTSFWVSDMAVFTRDVLPAYFKHNNYASFVRQLNMYGFRRNTTNQGRHGPGGYMVETFSHPMFLKGRKELLVHIQRKPATRNRSKSKDADESRVAQLEDKVSAMEAQLRELTATVEMSRIEMHMIREAAGLSGAAMPSPEHHQTSRGFLGSGTGTSPGMSRNLKSDMGNPMMTSSHSSQKMLDARSFPLGFESLSTSAIEQAFLLSSSADCGPGADLGNTIGNENVQLS